MKGAHVDQLSLGVVSRSRKEHERRLAIHPLHIERIDADLRERLYLERGYGDQFGMPDEQLAPMVAGLRTRDQLIAGCDVILLPKPLPEDLAGLREGQVLWGWPHCVQDEEITQLGIDRRLTLIAFEAMNHWSADGSFSLHVFHKNNELAGYCSVLHAMELIGATGEYGRRLRAAVIGFGESGWVPLADFLAEHDIVVNCVLQDTDAPLMFVTAGDLGSLAGSLLVDVSCDEGMGFSWARPTSFAEPMLMLGSNVRYYAVDHSPSYLWDSATWEISEALLPHLRAVLGGPGAWEGHETIRRAIEIRAGVIQNPRILSFQHRSPDYPHPGKARH